MLRPLLGLALTSLLVACQPVVPAAAPVQAADDARFLSLPEASTEGGMLPRARDVLLLEAADALEVPLQYERSRVETLVWAGDGQGMAELYNQHGQLLYRVKEGEPAQTVTVAAGRHTLTIHGAASQVLTMAEPEGTTGWRRHFEQVDALMQRVEPADSRGPIFNDPSQPQRFVPRPCRPPFGYFQAPPTWREMSEAMAQEVALNPHCSGSR